VSVREAPVARGITAADRATPHPVYCVWELTLACDLGCRHCGSRAGRARPGELSTSQCLDVVRELHELGVREVTLIGGEAYLRDDWDQIARAITTRGMRCTITTGARQLTDERVARAADAGVGAVSISVDGLEETHDAQRGVQGSWRAAVEAARRIAASPIQLGFNTQINRLSMPELPGVATLLADIGGTAWQVQLTVPMGRAADRPELLLQPYDLLELFPLLVWIRQRTLDPRGIALYLGNNVGYFSAFEPLLRPSGAGAGSRSSCGAGKWTIGLEADGKIKGCPSLPSNGFTGGFLGRDRLAEVVARAPELRGIRERTVDDLWGWCRSCAHAADCMGGCSWMSTMLFRRTGNNPYCVHRALALEAEGLRERVVRVEAAPGEPFDGGLFEIHVESAPVEDETASVLGLPLDAITATSPEQRGLWTASSIAHRLERS
jgi:radical SAM protein with 4Fe4S-binding SPASM domain